MPATPQYGHGGGWWLALPDAAVSTHTHHHGLPVLARHLSGRPLLLGTGIAAVTTEVGTVSIAALGDPLVDERTFTDRAHRAAARGDYDSLMSFPGSYQLIVGEPDRMLVYSDVAGLRRSYTARYDRCTVAGSHARIVAGLRSIGLDPVWAAARMCSPEMPTFLRDTRSPYEGVAPVAAGCRALLAGDQAPRITRYWHPPAPTRSLHQGALHLRAELENAISERVRRSAGPVTVQLSGGLDSAALAALAVAAAGSERVRLVTVPSPASGDLAWARLVADHLGAHHDVLDDAPELFADLPEAAPQDTDEPPPSTSGAARTAHTARALTTAGNGGLHLNGQGGDEVLGAPLAHLGPLLRSRQRGAIRHLRGHAALRGWPTLTLARHALVFPSYQRWLDSAATALDRDADPISDAVAWEAHPRLAPWASTHTRELIKDTLLGAEEHPFGNRTAHAGLARIRASASRARAYAQTMTAFGTDSIFPFFDRPVVEACLSVHPELRSNPWAFKPLLTAAICDALPQALLDRVTKGNYTPDIHRGWAQHGSRVLSLLRDPVLADIGVVDADRLHRALTGWGHRGIPPAYVTDLLAFELWTRALPTTPTREEAV